MRASDENETLYKNVLNNVNGNASINAEGKLINFNFAPSEEVSALAA
jgi:hypothetical protein